MILNLAIYERGSKFQTSSDIHVWCLGHEQQTKQYQIIKGNWSHTIDDWFAPFALAS
jgi:hypothetical protein